MPLRFLTQDLPFDILEHLLSCMEQQVAFSDRTLLTALAKDVQIIRVEKGHLGTMVQEEQRSVIQARIDLEKAERQAQQLLLRQQYLSPKDLQDHLLKRLAEEFVSHGMSEVAQDEERLEAALSLILVRYPGLLKEVEKQCAARFSFTRETEPLPGFIESAGCAHAVVQERVWSLSAGPESVGSGIREASRSRPGRHGAVVAPESGDARNTRWPSCGRTEAGFSRTSWSA